MYIQYTGHMVLINNQSINKNCKKAKKCLHYFPYTFYFISKKKMCNPIYFWTSGISLTYMHLKTGEYQFGDYQYLWTSHMSCLVQWKQLYFQIKQYKILLAVSSNATTEVWSTCRMKASTFSISICRGVVLWISVVNVNSVITPQSAN